MRIPDHPTFILRMLQHRLKKLAPSSPVLAASFADDARGQGAEEVKQDRELKALHRLLPRIKKTYPQLRFVTALDNLYACGPVFALAEQLGWSCVVTFKEGRTPALWREFRALRPACPDNVLKRTWGDGRVQEFRWVPQLAYEDSEGRRRKLNALDCRETTADGAEQYFAWLTSLPVGKRTVEEIAWKGGRCRWKVENEGFNRQKNSGLNLEHVCSIDPENWKAYYLLLQIAFLLVQLLERGGLLRRLAAEAGRPFWKLFGSLKNVARRPLDGVRFVTWEESWFDPRQAGKLRIELDGSQVARPEVFSGDAASSTGVRQKAPRCGGAQNARRAGPSRLGSYATRHPARRFLT